MASELRGPIGYESAAVWQQTHDCIGKEQRLNANADGTPGSADYRQAEDLSLNATARC
jgi:hypothetical protein